VSDFFKFLSKSFTHFTSSGTYLQSVPLCFSPLLASTYIEYTIDCGHVWSDRTWTRKCLLAG